MISYLTSWLPSWPFGSTEDPYADIDKQIDEVVARQDIVGILDAKQLDSLPPTIAKLKHIPELLIEGNQLLSIPKELGDLTRLTWIQVDATAITTLPESMGRLPKIDWLDVRNNEKLSAVPSKLRDLGYLGVSGTDITAEALEGRHDRSD